MIDNIFNIKFHIKRKGSATVEAAIIFPLIMFIVFGIIYLTIVHYQNNVMIAESVRAMNRAGAYYQYIDVDGFGKTINQNDDVTPLPFDEKLPADGIINIDMIKNRNAYRTMIDIISEGISKVFDMPVGEKKKNAKKYVLSRISSIKFNKYQIVTGVGDVEGGGAMFIGHDLNIDVGREYINPMQNLSNAIFGKNGFLSNKVIKKEILVRSVISNQVEFIRNFDTVYDVGENFINLFEGKR